MLLCTHLHSQCTQAIHVTVYSLTLSVNSGNTCYCVLTYTISELRQYMLLCTHLHSQCTQAIHVTVYTLTLSVHSGNTCYCVLTCTLSTLGQYMCFLSFYSQCTRTIHVYCVLILQIGIKEREMALVWHEKANRTALQTSSVSHTHTLLVQTHNMTKIKEIAEQCRQL